MFDLTKIISVTALFFPIVGLAQLVTTTPIATDVFRPTAIENAGDSSNRLFILQQSGQVLIYNNGELLNTPFLDIEDRVSCCRDRGLLGIAFHPQYSENGQFYVNYTNTEFNTVISRFTVSNDPDRADLDSEEVLLTVAQPFSNHNGGQLAFGPDDYLYIGLGDGGSAGDPLNTAQDPTTLLGKMLRIDVDNGIPYSIPTDNPFVSDEQTLGEIWAIGLRNPFRYSFDRITGDLFIADVGEDAIEEINFHAINSDSGENYGWRLMEGSQCFDPADNCNDGSLTLPVVEYNHSAGRCSITGGYRYRGTQVPDLIDYYVYADFCTGEIFGAAPNNDSVWTQHVLLDTNLDISTFGQNEAGELFVADINGGIYQLIAPLAISPASGIYLQSQFMDVGIALRLPGVTVLSFIADLSGSDVSSNLQDCLSAGVLSEGGLSFRCSQVPLNLLEPGQYEFSVELNLSNGNMVTNTVQWTILENSE